MVGGQLRIFCKCRGLGKGPGGATTGDIGTAPPAPLLCPREFTMPQWDSLISEKILSAVMPGAYRRYLQPIRKALILFLEGLPNQIQLEVLVQQALLPLAASPEERLTRLARTSPSLHKLGQTLARDHRLPAEFRRHLQQLESLPPTIPLSEIERLLTQELGPLHRLGITLQSPALAEASVAVVVPFQTQHPHKNLRHGVFKILKPCIEERLQYELATFSRIGACLDQTCHDLGIAHLDYEELLEQVREKLEQETRLDLEQRHLIKAAVLYEHDHRIQIPTLLEPCTPRVTAMQRVTGHKITDPGVVSPLESHRIAETAVAALITNPVFSQNADTFFHGDLHPGNLFITDDRRLAVLDWSLVGTITEHERVAIAQILLGATTLQPARVAAAIAQLAEQPPADIAAFHAVASTWVDRIRRGTFPGLSWLVGMLDEVVHTTALRPRHDLLLFRKTFHALEGTLADIGSTAADTDWALTRQFLDHLAREWPLRWQTPATSRAFPTRLSNADLAEWTFALPFSAMQIWLQRSLTPLF